MIVCTLGWNRVCETCEKKVYCKASYLFINISNGRHASDSIHTWIVTAYSDTLKHILVSTG